MEAVKILLVEDNEGDIFLTKEAFEEAKIKTEITAIKNGRDAVNYILKNGEYARARTPDLILLDINMPIMNGHEVLDVIKTHETYKKIPILMLTTSSSQEDIDKAYVNHANGYVTKPLEFESFLKAILKIENFWLGLCTKPKID